jgi:hypothetical protein
MQFVRWVVLLLHAEAAAGVIGRRLEGVDKRRLQDVIVGPEINKVCTNGVQLATGECECDPGYVFRATTCEPCPIGQYEADGEEVCVDCPETYTTHEPGASNVTFCVCEPGVREVKDEVTGEPYCNKIDPALIDGEEFGFAWRHFTFQLQTGALFEVVMVCTGFISKSAMSQSNRESLMSVVTKMEYHFNHNSLYLVVTLFFSTFQALYFFFRSIHRTTHNLGDNLDMTAALIFLVETVVLLLHAIHTNLSLGIMYSVIDLPRDAMIVMSTFTLPFNDVDGVPTWFSFGFLSAMRAFSCVQKMLSISHLGPNSVKSQVISVVVKIICSIYVMACIMFALETLGDPLFLVEYNAKKWNLVSAFYFIFVTISTVGYGDLSPETGLGRIVVLIAIFGGIAQFSVAINQIVEAVKLNKAGHGSFTPAPRVEPIVICGNPSGPMLMTFLKELFHPDHKDASQNLQVVVLLPEGASALDEVTKFLKRKTNQHIILKVHLLAGTVLDNVDQQRIAVEEAHCFYVLPDIFRADTTQEDLESIVRVLALRRTCPDTRIIVLLHRAVHKELLNGTGASTDVICIDQLKLQLIGKSTAVPGFSTMVCNLCKTWSIQKLKRTPTQGQQMSQGIAEEMEWLNEYDLGLGAELYEVPLSTYYWGKINYTFPMIAKEILDMSINKDVYLIGLVELERKPKGRWQKQFAPRGTGGDWQTSDGFIPAPNNRRKRVLLNPGRHYIVRSEPFVTTFGIFIAPDRDAIYQHDATEKKRDEEEEEPDDEEEQQAAADQAALKKSGPKQKVTAEEREQRRLEAERKDLAMQEQAVQSGMSSTNMDALTLAATVNSAQGGYRRKPTKELLRNRPLRDALRPLEPTEDKIALMNEVFEDGRAASKYETQLLSEGDHVLFITFQSGEDSIGLEHFVGPIRSSSLATSQDGYHGPPIFILGPAKPADWYAITQYADVYFVEGNPFLLFDLERVNFQWASSIFVSSPPRGVGNDPAMADADAIFIVRMIEAELRAPQNIKLRDGRPPPPVTVEITLDSNHHFLPMPKMAGENEEVPEDEEDDEDDLVSNVDEFSVQPKKTSKFARLMRKLRGKGDDVVKKTGSSNDVAKAADPGKQKSARTAAADAQQLADVASEYLRQPRYACGQLFVSSIVTSLAVNSFYNHSLAHMIEAMIDAQILMVDVGKGWHREPFYDFYKHVLENRDLLAIGIFRKVMIDNKPNSGFQEASKAKEKLMGKKRKKKNSIFALMPDNYVFSSPPAKGTFLTMHDTVICVMKKDWSKIPERYGPQLRSMNYGKHANLSKSANQGLQMSMGMSQNLSQAQTTANSLALSGGNNSMNTSASQQMVPAGGAAGAMAMNNSHHPPSTQPAGQWSTLRETSGSAAVGGPMALPPPPGVKGPHNPNAQQLAIPGQL